MARPKLRTPSELRSGFASSALVVRMTGRGRILFAFHNASIRAGSASASMPVTFRVIFGRLKFGRIAETSPEEFPCRRGTAQRDGAKIGNGPTPALSAQNRQLVLSITSHKPKQNRV
jgi:hypothetical protein